MTPAQIAKLRALEKGASTAPWAIDDAPEADGGLMVFSKAGSTAVAHEIDDWDDAALIAEFRNALPELLDAAERVAELRAQAAVARAAMQTARSALANDPEQRGAATTERARSLLDDALAGTAGVAFLESLSATQAMFAETRATLDARLATEDEALAIARREGAAAAEARVAELEAALEGLCDAVSAGNILGDVAAGDLASASDWERNVDAARKIARAALKTAETARGGRRGHEP